MREGRYILSQGDRYAQIAAVSEETLEEHERDMTAIKGYLSASFGTNEEGVEETVGEFYLKALEIGEVLGQTDEGRVVSRFEDGVYISDVDLYDRDPFPDDHDLDEVDMLVW